MGDEHSYSEPKDFLVDLAENYQEKEIGRKILKKNLNKTFNYEIVQNEDDKYIFVKKEALKDEKTEEQPTLKDAKWWMDNYKASMISDALAYETLNHPTKLLQNPNAVMTSIRQKVNRDFPYSIIKVENRYFLIDAKKYKHYYNRDEFDSKEEALEFLEEEKERWIENDALYAFSYAELQEIIAEDNIILPIYIYDHSGQTIRTTPFGDRWDSGQIGWIYASKETFRNETLYKESELFSTDPHRTPIVGEHVMIKGYKEEETYRYGMVREVKENQVTVDFDSHKALFARKPENVVTVALDEIEEVMSERAKEILENQIKTYDQYLQNEVYGYIIEEKEIVEDGEVETREIQSCWGFYGDNPFENGMSDDIPKKYHELLRELA